MTDVQAARARFVSEAHVAAEIERLSQHLEQVTYQYAGLAEQAAVGEASYKALHARRFLLATTGTAKVSAAQAEKIADNDDAVAAAYLERKIGEAKADAARESMRSIRTQLDALRTLAASFRAQTNG